MVDEYIRKQNAVNVVANTAKIVASFNYQYAIDALFALTPATDVVPVVRCKDCKFRENDDFCVGRGFPYQLVAGDEFCSRAKTKEHIND